MSIGGTSPTPMQALSTVQVSLSTYGRRYFPKIPDVCSIVFFFLLRIALRVAVDSVRNSRRALYVRHDYDGHMRAIIFHFRRCNQGKVGARATRFESPEWDVAAGE